VADISAAFAGLGVPCGSIQTGQPPGIGQFTCSGIVHGVKVLAVFDVSSQNISRIALSASRSGGNAGAVTALQALIKSLADVLNSHLADFAGQISNWPQDETILRASDGTQALTALLDHSLVLTIIPE
jgi:hypothetical protein